jgi:hypothetical protein
MNQPLFLYKDGWHKIPTALYYVKRYGALFKSNRGKWKYAINTFYDQSSIMMMEGRGSAFSHLCNMGYSH